MPKVPVKRILLAFGLPAWLLMQIAVANWLPSNLAFVRGTGTAALSLNLAGVLDAVTTANTQVIFGSLTLFFAALFLLQLVPITSFRLKRLLFNLYLPDQQGGQGSSGSAAMRTPEGRRGTTAAEHRWRSAGIYALERKVFKELGTRPPLEVPFDLLAEAALPLAMLLLVVTDLALPANRNATVANDPAFAAIEIVLARLGWLFFVWCQRVSRIRGTQEQAPQPLPALLTAVDAAALALLIALAMKAADVTRFSVGTALIVATLVFPQPITAALVAARANAHPFLRGAVGGVITGVFVTAGFELPRTFIGREGVWEVIGLVIGTGTGISLLAALISAKGSAWERSDRQERSGLRRVAWIAAATGAVVVAAPISAYVVLVIESMVASI